MNSRFIPMGADPRGHDMHDDTAAWAQENVRPFRHEVCRNTCGGGQSCNCIMPAEASTELGANQPPKRRLGHTGRRHSWVLRHQVQITAVLSVMAFAALLWMAKP